MKHYLEEGLQTGRNQNTCVWPGLTGNNIPLPS